MTAIMVAGVKTQDVKENFVAKIGIPEVDRILEAQKFRFADRRWDTKPYPSFASLEDKDDHIGQLPSHIIEFIISLLPMKQGAMSSLLAKRWRNLWTSSVSCLDFNASTLFGDKYLNNTSELKPEEFISRVDGLLQSRSALNLDALQVSFPFTEESASHINEWVKFAAAQGIRELKLDFGLTVDHTKAYKFPTQTFAQQRHLKYLSLTSCMFEFPCDFKGFNSLVSLALVRTRLTQLDVRNILSNCSSLERLSLYFIDFPLGNHSLTFSSPSLVLKHICCGPCVNIREIEVRDINVLSFELEFKYPNSKLSIKNVPKLARLVLATYCPTKITCEVPHLEMLFLSTWLEECIRPKLCDLKQLKQLVVLAIGNNRINLLEVVYMLEACPLLQKLKLDMGTSIERDDILDNIRARPKAANNNLKHVDIYGFEGHGTKIEFTKYLLKYAVVLERIKMSTKRMVYFNNGVWSRYERKQTLEGMSLDEVCEELKKEARLPTEFVIGSVD